MRIHLYTILITMFSFIHGSQACAQLADYADTGSGQHHDEILWMTWAGTDLADGIHNGDQVIYTMPNGGTLQLDFSNVSIAYPVPDPTPADGETPDGYLPSDMKIWCGATLYTAYDLSGSTSEVLISDKNTAGVVGAGENGQDIAFDLTLTATVNGQVIPVDVILADPETTNPAGGFQEELRFTTNVGSWGLLENINGNTYGLAGLGTAIASITDTESGVACSGGVNSGTNSSPLLLSKGINGTSTTVRMEAIFPAGDGHQGFAMAALMPVDQSDAPLSYGVASHIQELEVPFGGGPGLANVSTLHLGAIPGDSDDYIHNPALIGAALTGDDLDDIDDEDGFNASGSISIASTPLRTLTILASAFPLLNSSGSSAVLHAWVDFDENLSFDPDEYASVLVSDGNVNPDGDLTFLLPPDVIYGSKLIRLRLSSDNTLGASTSYGIAINGEVEDHIFSMIDICTDPSFGDNDGDLLNDVCDYDDDNDGIPDDVEGCEDADIAGTIGIGSSVTSTSYILNGTTLTYARSGISEANIRGYAAGSQGDAIRLTASSGNNGTLSSTFTNPVSSVYFKLTDFDEFEQYTINIYDTDNNVYDLSAEGVLLVGSTILQTGNLFVCQTSETTAAGPSVDGNDPTDDPLGSVIIFIPGTVRRIDLIYNHPLGSSIRYIEPTFCSVDSDSDGIFNHLDLDSDNDGIYDAIESGSGEAQTAGVLSGGVDTDGIPLSVSNGSSGVNYIYADTDADSSLNPYDSDSDNDGCPDVTEAGFPDADGDQQLGGLVPPNVDSKGVVTSGGL